MISFESLSISIQITGLLLIDKDLQHGGVTFLFVASVLFYLPETEGQFILTDDPESQSLCKYR